MSYNKQIGEFKEVMEKSLAGGKEAILLFKNNYNNSYYQLKEFTCFIEKIEPSEKRTDMWELTLIFNDGERATTQVFIDDSNIKEKSIISVIGYVTKYNGQYQLYCRGITPIYTSLEELAESEPDINKFIKVSLCINLSDIEVTRVFTEKDNMQPLGQTGYYYIVVQKIKSMDSSQKMDFIKNMVNSMYAKKENNKDMTNNVEEDKPQQDNSEVTTQVAE